MDKMKIGQFIAECRRSKKITQEQLAEKLGVSKNAVSKWERGICLMDMSLLKPLSVILDVSVNDILSGEIIDEKDLKDKSDENIINVSKLNDLKSIKIGAVALSAIAIILIIYCVIKDISPYGFISMICAYNGLFFCSKYNFQKDKSYLTIGIIFLIAMFLNIIAFILNTI